MRRNRKGQLLFLGLFFLCGLLATFMGVRGMETKGRHYIAIVTKSTESAFFKSVFAGANAAGTEYNAILTMEGPKTEEDYETQNQLIKKAVGKGAEAIVISAVDYNNNADAVNEAAKKGVGIVVIDSDVASTEVSCRIGTDNFLAGRMAGTAVLNSPELELNVGIINYDVHTANGQQREDGFRKRVEEDIRVKGIYTINVLSTIEDAREGAIKLLNEHPEINVVATFNEWTSLGVGWAIRDLGLKEETTVVAFDSNVVSVGMLETGEVDALIVQNPYSMGYLGVEKAFQLCEGRKPDAERIDTETTMVTRETMYLPEYQKILFSFD